MTRRRWLGEERFLYWFGASNLIPGPKSSEMAIHIGWARRRCRLGDARRAAWMRPPPSKPQ